jgi:hypothetical protein
MAKKNNKKAAENLKKAYDSPSYKRKEPLAPSLGTKPKSGKVPYSALGPDEKRERDKLNAKKKKK